MQSADLHQETLVFEPYLSMEVGFVLLFVVVVQAVAVIGVGLPVLVMKNLV